MCIIPDCVCLGGVGMRGSGGGEWWGWSEQGVEAAVMLDDKCNDKYY